MSLNADIDDKPADRAWLTLWNHARAAFNVVAKADNARDRWKGKSRYRRVLTAMRDVREGKTEYGPVTSYNDAWILAIQLKATAEGVNATAGIFRAAASNPPAGPGIDLHAPVGEPTLWVNHRNRLPHMDADKPARASVH